jgi:riboflavin kinase/FMN adenylyltransferase
MKILRNLEELPKPYGPSLVSVGNFDGVHRAHQRVLAEIVLRSKQRGASSLAVTFEPHPVRILRPDSPLKLLTPTPEKLRLLEASGIDAVLLLPFTRDISLVSAEEFVREILSRRLGAVEVHEGFNFHFGHKAAGNVKVLARLGSELGFEVVIYPEMRMRGELVSSSRIRELIQAGGVGRARALLGRPFSICATAGRGRGYGAKYTVPTINLSRYEELIPKDGVYITRTRVGVECFESVTNVGTRPTFGTDSFAVESHLLDFHPLELTPETEIELFFLSRLRDEVKFSSVEELRRQIHRDIQKTQRCFHQLRLKTGMVGAKP